MSERHKRRFPQALFPMLAVALGCLHTWAAVTSYSMSEDGVNYLDMADAYARGDWNTAVNSVWSPLYSWILGPILRLISPAMRWEFAVVQLINFGIYLGALVGFAFFWNQLGRYRLAQKLDNHAEGHVSLPEWVWIALGYTLFMWVSLTLIRVWAVTPDMLMTGLVYLAAGLILRIRLRRARWFVYGLLGMVLGLSYLAKSVMFPIAFVLLAVSLFATGDLRRAVPRVLVASLVFAVISVPYILAISRTTGKLTFGDAGALTYVRHVNGLQYPHWQGEPAGHGIPEHPSRRILDFPPVYEFGTPIGGTYPISYDPAYWYQGAVPRFRLEQQINGLMSSLLFYLDLFFRQQGVLLAGVLVLYAMRPRVHLRLTDVVRRWGLMIPALVAMSMYAVVYVEGRYVGAFIILLWGDLLANVRLPGSRASREWASRVGVVMVLFMLMNIVLFNLQGYRDLTGRGDLGRSANDQRGSLTWPGEVAEELHGLGIEQGDKVAVIGYGFDSFWARLARVRIVAEMLGWEADPFWLGDEALQAEVIEAFSSAGAEAVVAENVPPYASLVGWHRVGKSDYYILPLSP